MAPVEVQRLHARLVSLLIRQDARRIRDDLRRRIPPNHYALAHEIGAAQRARDTASDVASYVAALQSEFHPFPMLRTFLRTLDPTVEVRRGCWIQTDAVSVKQEWRSER